MSSLSDSVRRTIRRHGLLQRDARVIVALSGGADSVALLLTLREMASDEGFQLAGAAHLNHQLRGVEADGDEEFCRRLAASHGIPIDVERLDVARLAGAAGVSVEQAAHTARHEFFDRAVERLDAAAVAVAHTRDDQAETFLLRLLRGAGPRGLGGMHPRSGRVIRPFLAASRSDVRAFLHARQAEFREDASNADLTIARNRIRHDLIPYLETRFSPGIVDVLDREAAIAREDAEFLDKAAAAAGRRLVARTSEGVELVVAALLAEPAAIARRVIRGAQEMVSAGRFVGFDAVETVLAFAVSKSTGPLDLPGHRVSRRGGRIVLTTSQGRRAAEPTAAFLYELMVPGEVSVPEAACAILADAEVVPSGHSAGGLWPLVNRGDQVVVEAGRLAGPLVVRNRRPGDSFRPLGLQGHKKLQDFFVDAKVERSERDTVPLVIDARGEIVWVAGHTVGEEFRVTDHTQAVVILTRVRV
jgi:tRNA(Ile)-lysidine synthase